MRYALALLVMLAGCAPSMRVIGVPQSIGRVEIDPHLLDLLNRMHGWFEDEVAVCLVGEEGRGAVRVTRIGALRNSDPERNTVQIGACRGPGVVGLFHNHPDGTCAFSRDDMAASERLGHTLDLLSCGNGRFRWRLRSTSGQITAAGP